MPVDQSTRTASSAQAAFNNLGVLLTYLFNINFTHTHTHTHSLHIYARVTVTVAWIPFRTKLAIITLNNDRPRRTPVRHFVKIKLWNTESCTYDNRLLLDDAGRSTESAVFLRHVTAARLSLFLWIQWLLLLALLLLLLLRQCFHVRHRRYRLLGQRMSDGRHGNMTAVM